ncbi:MAG: 16S rRNA (adenine(1518)-N(6)/adenine(1519)-N(6))-dimethyltransferase RsmA [Xanthomonadaceae bacterium]|nr:16S rRNA (adenine(1518)-N(6)/adenine(1519)-N(6))-dimethyltransferase RsmA [Xanthomonadaceae bacterium]
MIQTSHRPRKRFGQHFLHDGGVIAKIVDTIAPQSGERLVEIGPGLGALTIPLLQRHGRLEVVELDRDLIPLLVERCLEVGALVVHQGDALRFDFTALASGERIRLVGNLPYNISTPLLFHLLDHSAVIDDMHFMLQKEVVDRMAASAGDDAYGRLSVMLAARCAVQPLFEIGPGAFTPPPKVDSAIVRLVPHRQPPFALGDPERFARIVNQAFSMRRKTLRNALRGLVDAEGIEAAGLDPGARPETVSPEAFGRLAATSGATPDSR